MRPLHAKWLVHASRLLTSDNGILSRTEASAGAGCTCCVSSAAYACLARCGRQYEGAGTRMIGQADG